jgi:AbrB family looped-hinge helix DNA binding protein
MTSTITVRGQTAIPAAIRRRYNLQAHSRIEWIDDGHSVTVVPVPQDPIRALRGMYRTRNLSSALATARLKERARG